MKFSFAVAACLPTLGLSAALLPRYNWAEGQCDAAKAPDIGDCDGAYQNINNTAGGDPGFIFTPPGAGNTLTYTNGNCVVGLIFYDPSYTVDYDLVTQGIGIYTSYCSTIPAGGQATLTGGQFAVSVDAPGNPPAKVKRISARTGLPAVENENKDILNKRDETWSNAYTVDNASPNQYWQQVLNALPGGSNWQLTDSESQTNMVQSTTTISADLFGAFSASESITYGYTDTVTTSTTETIVNNCANDQEGYLYWTPLFTQYHGGFVPDGPRPLDIYVPLTNSDGSAAGNYVVQCSEQ